MTGFSYIHHALLPISWQEEFAAHGGSLLLVPSPGRFLADAAGDARRTQMPGVVERLDPDRRIQGRERLGALRGERECGRVRLHGARDAENLPCAVEALRPQPQVVSSFRRPGDVQQESRPSMGPWAVRPPRPSPQIEPPPGSRQARGQAPTSPHSYLATGREDNCRGNGTAVPSDRRRSETGKPGGRQPNGEGVDAGG